MIHVGIVRDVDSVWPQIAANMQEACDNGGGGRKAGDLWTAVRMGRSFLICAGTEEKMLMSSVWRFETEPDAFILRCEALAAEEGSMKTWIMDTYRFVNAMARDNGAKWLVAGGRDGWLGVFKQAVKRNEDDFAVEVRNG